MVAPRQTSTRSVPSEIVAASGGGVAVSGSAGVSETSKTHSGTGPLARGSEPQSPAEVGRNTAMRCAPLIAGVKVQNPSTFVTVAPSHAPPSTE